jgi:hypothetical protein
MNEEDFKILSDKVAAGTATQEEILLFAQELNTTIKNLRNNLTSIKK